MEERKGIETIAMGTSDDLVSREKSSNNLNLIGKPAAPDTSLHDSPSTNLNSKPCKAEPASIPAREEERRSQACISKELEPDSKQDGVADLPLEEAFNGLGMKKRTVDHTQSKTKCTGEPNSNQEGTECKSRREDFLFRIGLQKKDRKLFMILNCSTKDCQLCDSKASLTKVIVNNLNKKYLTTRESYNAKVVNDIVYNENTHVVSVFKDFLIYDDISEYLKRFYAGHESTQRLPKIFDFYDKYSKVFPNYIALKENAFMFKNIERKQRVIDDEQKRTDEKRKKPRAKKVEEESEAGNKVFTTLFLQDLNRPDSTMSWDDSEGKIPNESQLRSFLQHQSRRDSKKGGRIEDMSLRKLVDQFISKDSQSLIDVTGALSKFDDPKTKPEECPIAVKKESESKIIPKGLVSHVRSNSDLNARRKESATAAKKVPFNPNNELNIKMLIKPRSMLPERHSRAESAMRAQSPTEQFSSRNAMPGLGLCTRGNDKEVWTTIKGRMTSHRKSGEVRVRMGSPSHTNKGVVIVTRQGNAGKRKGVPEARSASQRSREGGPRIGKKTDTPFCEALGLVHGGSPAAKGKMLAKDAIIGDFEAYARPLTLNPRETTIKAKTGGYQNSRLQLPSRSPQDFSPVQVREIFPKKMSCSGRPTNPPTSHRRVPTMQPKIELFDENVAGRNQKGLGADLGTRTVVKGKLGSETETAKGVKSAYCPKKYESKFKSDYLNKLQKRNNQDLQVVGKLQIERAETIARNLEAFGELGYFKSAAILDKGPVVKPSSSTKGIFQASRNSGTLGVTTNASKCKRSGSYNTNNNNNNKIRTTRRK